MIVENDDFKTGLTALLANEAWRAKGEAGWVYVRDNFEIDAVLERHLRVYEDLMKKGRRR